MAPLGSATAANQPTGENAARAELLAFVLRRAAAVVMQDFQICLAAEDIRPIQFLILSTLRANPGVRQSQLSPKLGVRRTNLVPLLSELEKRGLCERRPVPGDRRAAALSVTDMGEALYLRCAVHARRQDARLSARVGPEGRAMLLGLLARLSDGAVNPETDGQDSE